MSNQIKDRSSLTDIVQRHGRDRWKDATFIATAVLLTALSIGALTSRGVGKSLRREWTVTVVDTGTNLELGK
jgi:hypothetical protein